MKKFNLAITLIAVFFLTGMQAKAQVNSNITGLWTGNDNQGNVVEIKFNSDNSCIFKINGNPSNIINTYHVLLEDPVTGEAFDAIHPLIYFSSSILATADENQNVVSIDAASTSINSTSYKFTGVFTPSYNELNITTNEQIFNNGDDNSSYVINLTK